MAGVFPTTAGADVVTAITGAITDNIAPILVVLGFVVGLKIAMRLFNGGLRGRAKV
jgi:hypothetical protein